MKHYFWFGIVSMMVLALAGCTTPRSTWRSVPDVVMESTDALEAKLTLLRQDKPYFVGFELTLHNKTGKPIEINWNETRYLHGNRDMGILVFPGVSAEDVKNTTLPNEEIPAGHTLVKRVSPARTIAWTPKRMAASADEPAITAGILPNGNNSVSLSLSQGYKTWRQTLTVRIVENKGQ